MTNSIRSSRQRSVLGLEHAYIKGGERCFRLWSGPQVFTRIVQPVAVDGTIAPHVTQACLRHA